MPLGWRRSTRPAARLSPAPRTETARPARPRRAGPESIRWGVGCDSGTVALFMRSKRGCTSARRRPPAVPARQTAVIRMALSTTERLVWHCGDHTVKLESASGGRFSRGLFLIPKICCFLWRVHASVWGGGGTWAFARRRALHCGVPNPKPAWTAWCHVAVRTAAARGSRRACRGYSPRRTPGARHTRGESAVCQHLARTHALHIFVAEIWTRRWAHARSAPAHPLAAIRGGCCHTCSALCVSLVLIE